jgi:hypothetical protein
MDVTSKHMKHIDHFKVQLRKQFEISNLGKPTWLVGLKVECDRINHTIMLSQKVYVETILECFDEN